MGCCGGASCVCKLEGGTGITVSGTGTPQDPFIVTADSQLEVTDNSVFDLTLLGNELSVAFAATAKLDDIPDVNAPAPTNAQVLGWDSATSRWTARAPTTAASGSVQHDTSLSGDGSGGSPLQVVEDPIRFLVTGAGGLGLSDAGINMLVRGFVDSTARSAASPVPDLNALSMLDTRPGIIDYWNGSAWLPVPGQMPFRFTGTELLVMSGTYVPGQQVTQIAKTVDTTTDGSGTFDVLDPTDLNLAAGVLTCQFQETGLIGFKAVVNPAVDRIQATAYRLDDGTPYVAQPITGTALGYIY